MFPQAFSIFYQIHARTVAKLYHGDLNRIEILIYTFIMDIDVFQEQIIDKSLDSLIINFTEIRNIKNDIFENCITPATRELFK